VKVRCISPQGHALSTDLTTLLDAELRETTRVESNQWIKRLRLVRYGDATMRERFTYRGDSLWWFTEIYLHKMRQLEEAVSIVLALDAAAAQHAPHRMEIDTASMAARDAARAFASARGITIDITGEAPADRSRAWQSYLVGLTARLSRLRPGRRASPSHHPTAAVFVHTAFWRDADPQHESYIGPVLQTLTDRLGDRDLFCVGIGPRRNFRARRWWDPLAGARRSGAPVTPVEQLASSDALESSRELWRQRDALARDLTAGDSVRAAGEFRRCDLWPVLQRELADAAVVQWPWSARAMDEAGAALDALQPRVAVTYAEAGGWGRALVLEARRRGVPSAGIQHGFIYRHWLNYHHEADEMEPVGADRGFPRPDRTLLFDRYTAETLENAGHFPSSSLSITGSARLDDLVARLTALRPRREELRRGLGVDGRQPTAALAAKFSEIRDVLPDLLSAVRGLPGMTLVIKPHPAETTAVYEPFVGHTPNVSITPPGADLATVLASVDALVTMNSTVAIDGLVLGLPALVIGLPNNLSPFVSAGVMLGADSAEKIQQGLKSVLYDRQVRNELAVRAEIFVDRYALAPDGHAAVRAANEILALAGAP
jgi:hypothetical protein